VDLVGEQTVQTAVTAAQAALLLLAGVLLMLLSVHLAKSAIQRPTLARVRWRTGRLVLPDSSEMISDLGLRTRLPARGPPGGPPAGSPDSPIHCRAQDPPGDANSG
jgi:hypothetical protein